MTREEMLEKYKDEGMLEKGTCKITLEIPKVFEQDLYKKGMFTDNMFMECFERVLAEVQVNKMPTIGRYEIETLTMLAIAFGNAKVTESEVKR